MERASAFVKVPRDRIGALIGPDGRVKASIEKKLSVELRIDSQSGDIKIILMPTVQDPTVLFRAREVITAIGRGFSPEHAFRLLKDDESVLEVIDLREKVGRSQSEMKRLKGRIIGKEGKTRRLIEELTDTSVSVYGHTVSIIGNVEKADVAKEAVLMLIRGSLHQTVYRFLHRKREKFKKKKMELWETPNKEL
ncbi:MAG: polynucleotide phosphorylase/polyadenylase [Candidatus Bathyarchaeota archaeon BA2]|nr:MAG: polynucleotide phosphorylase/polyadenylase [Candidatus Bathyarchaeota archaeon BA2]